MRKQLVALLVAFGLTGIVGLAMLVVGVNAAANTNGVAVSNSPAQASVANSSGTSASSKDAQIAQLQNLVAQYQAREQQYQTALQNDQQQINQAQQQMQSVQQLLNFLQQRGIIYIDGQGNITVLGGGRDGGG